MCAEWKQILFMINVHLQEHHHLCDRLIAGQHLNAPHPQPHTPRPPAG